MPESKAPVNSIIGAALQLTFSALFFRWHNILYKPSALQAVRKCCSDTRNHAMMLFMGFVHKAIVLRL